ncbi:MAG: Pyridinium-3,5-bisthiocarboxylic acid mononucleotide nickel insertion protein [Syntrophus sp. SKADARSKE-3]|nr:Pyridinium-3,5-bisthiocarboxylic acid mononucleotide nickel insertion protein [Syntrophus sp. SKADARSKE-3]
MKILYYDCFSGISGDMNLGAMLDLGVDRDILARELKKLNIGPYDLRITRDSRRGITGTRVEVIIDQEIHDDDHSHHGRTFGDIQAMIRGSGLSDAVKKISLDIFSRIAVAEAKVHGRDVSDVHFHEVGAVDSIVDIVGAAVCFDYFKADKIVASHIQVGGGFVKCAHGILPVPAPATVEILKGIPIKSGLVPFETTTPTGAAIVAAMAESFTDAAAFTPEKIGYGIGHRDTEVPNVLRVFLGSMAADEAGGSDVERTEALVIECNMDDMNPEHYGFLMERLFENGAHDVFFTPIVMKKSRPAVTLSVLCDASRRMAVEDCLWRHSSTFGLRAYKVSKAMLRREMEKVSITHGEIDVKHGYLQGKKIKSKPEYEDCRRVAREKGLSLEEVYDIVREELKKK